MVLKKIKKIISLCLALSLLCFTPSIFGFHGLFVQISGEDTPVLTVIGESDGAKSEWDGKSDLHLSGACEISVDADFVTDKSIIVDENANVVFDGKNHIIKVNSFIIKNGATLNISDGIFCNYLEEKSESVLFDNSGTLLVDGAHLNVRGGTILKSASSGDVWMKNVNILYNCADLTDGHSHGSYQIENNGGIMTFNGCHIDIYNADRSYPIWSDGGTLNFNDCAVNFDGYMRSINNATVNFDGGEYKCEDTYIDEDEYNYFIYSIGSSVNVKNGTVWGIFNSDEDGVVGSVTVTGGKVTMGDYGWYAITNYGELYIQGGEVSDFCNIENSAADPSDMTYAEISGGKVGPAKLNAIQNDTNCTVTIRGGEVKSSWRDDSKVTYCIDNYGTLIVSDGTVEAYGYAVYNNSNGAVAKISGGKLISENRSGIINNSGSTVEISGGEVTAKGTDSAIKGKGFVKITGGIVSSGGWGIYSNAEVTGGTIKDCGYGGIYWRTGLTIGGNVKFENNPGGDIHLPEGAVFTLKDDFRNTASVQIYDSNVQWGDYRQITTDGTSEQMTQKITSVPDWLGVVYEDGAGHLSLFACQHELGDYQSDENDHWKICTICGKEIRSEHQWNDGEIQADSDTIKYTCTDCGAEKICDLGKIETEVNTDENAPAASFETPRHEIIEIVLTDEEKEKADSGDTIKIILTVKDAEKTVPEADKALVASEIGKLTDYKLGQYLDISLLKKIGEREAEKITETKSLIKISFEIPEKLLGKSEYKVIRIHNGEAAVLEDKDGNPETVAIETDKFSTYALVFTEKSSSTDIDPEKPTTPTEPTTSVTPNIRPVPNAGENAEGNTENSPSDSSSQTQPPAESAPGENSDSSDKNQNTGVDSHIGLFIALGVAAAYVFIVMYFTTGSYGMTEERKERTVKAIIEWGKKNKLRRIPALALILAVLVYYYTVGQKPMFSKETGKF